MIRTATAVWKGNLKDGSGLVSTQSGTLSATPYTFRMRFEDAPGTNPEELIAAAHAGCFAMAFSAQMGERGITPDVVEATAEITMEALTLTKSHLKVSVSAPGADAALVEEAAKAAETGCPISKVLNLEITLDLIVSV